MEKKYDTPYGFLAYALYGDSDSARNLYIASNTGVPLSGNKGGILDVLFDRYPGSYQNIYRRHPDFPDIVEELFTRLGFVKESGNPPKGLFHESGLVHNELPLMAICKVG
ncbi:MAG: hypothetical protein CEO21_20, partial [Microgenomates group bacterium Gr01-1014_80]